jgi:hypothetical protein
MGARVIDRLEGRLDRVVAALFGGAVGYSAYLVFQGVTEPALAYGCAAGALGTWISARTLGRVPGREAGFLLPPFELRAVDFVEPEELLLTDLAENGELLLTECLEADELLLSEADRLKPAASEPLVLDDILAEIGPDSRVVRLFDRRSMPTPGQLQSRIDGHLRQAGGSPSVPDASEALSNALAELRRSLR